MVLKKKSLKSNKKQKTGKKTIKAKKLKEKINIDLLDEYQSISPSEKGTTKIVKEKQQQPYLRVSKDENQKIDKLIKNIKAFDEWYNNNDKKLQKLLLELNKKESDILGNNPDKLNFLYPHLLDPNFNVKIAEKKEFNDLVYDTDIKDVEKEADIMCNAGFELSPHQIFVRNFLSFLTPYNSLLLYHGLGTGKTCSAISVCEEMRDYMNQMGIQKRIIIVASPNVQNNFKLQLFDERKLKEINGLWDLRACTGNKLLKEINPMNMKGIPKDKIVKQIKNIINNSYVFMGYIEFSNYITKLQKRYTVEGDEEATLKNKKKTIRTEFSNRLIVIDEVHNIRIGGDTPNKTIAKNLLDMVNYSDTLKLLLLSATPMFNSYKEIIWLLNLMNINDKRPKIEVRDIFDNNGNFKIKDRVEVGKEILIQKMRGYVSFVRGENPYTFPYRIYPSDYNKNLTLKNPNFSYPKKQLNGANIIQGIEYLDIFTNKIGDYQQYGYEIAKWNLRNNLPDEVTMDKGMGWMNVELPLQTLNFVYPNSKLDTVIEKLKDVKKGEDTINYEKIYDGIEIRGFIGRQGLLRVMKYNESNKRGFQYKDEPLQKYGNIFASDNISKYSMKLYNIMDMIKKSKGIVLLYSQYIDGGCVPIALALEELGITRYNNDNLFLKEPTEKIDSVYMKTKSQLNKENKTVFNPARYIMITGDSKLSPNNLKEIKAATNNDNVNGEKVKVIIISKAGSEGIDLNNIRQVHIIEPWYNMSRTDQIIGRAVRFRSHCRLPFRERNVEIYLHGSLEDKNDKDDKDETESIDMYIYRMAEKKSIQMGLVSRVMKENAIDCYLNEGLNNLTQKNMKQSVELLLSTGDKIKYKVGDKKFTQICDYMEKCKFTCKPEKKKSTFKVNMDSYNEEFIILNIDKIVSNIKEIFKQRYVYKKVDLIKTITYIRKYPLIQINKALDFLINEKSEYIVDMIGRLGRLENIGDLYFFKPLEYETNNITTYKMRHPIDYKHNSIKLKLSDELREAPLLEYKGDDDETGDKESSRKLKSLSKTKKKQKQKQNHSEGYDKEKDIINSLLDDLYNKYNTSIINEKIIRGDNDWFKHSSITINKLAEIIPIQNLRSYVIHHLIDTLESQDKIRIIEYINFVSSSVKPVVDKDFIREITDYINNKLLVRENDDDTGITGYLIGENSKINLYILDNNKLEKAKPTDIEDLKESIQHKIIKSGIINDFVGFMMEISKSGLVIFKTKNMLDKRSRGARCDQAGKKTQLKILNIIYNDPIKYTSQNSKAFKIPQLCSEQEFLLRYYDETKKDGKRWFFNYEEALINKLDKIY